MARMRRGFGGGSAVISLMVVFLVCFIFSLILAIVFFNNMRAAMDSASSARKDLEKYVKQTEKGPFQAERGDPPKGESYTGALMAEHRSLKQLVIGDPKISMDQIKDRASSLPEGRTLFGQIEKLEAELSSAESLLKAKDGQIKEAQALAAAAEQAKNAKIESIDKSIEEIKTTFASAESGYNTSVAASAAALDKLQKDSHSVLVDKDNEIKRQEVTIQQKDQEISGLKARIRELQPIKNQSPVPDPSLLPDGTIVSILQEENLVYIDRGRVHHMVAGMTFEVFDHSTGVTKDEHGEYRGKASIEVVSMSDNSSVARIVRRTPRKTILEGDIIANAVYDPNYRFKFVVFGDFDIDNIGQASQSDKQRIKTVITQWGGMLSDELTYDTDFLVLGQEPKFPDPLPPTTIEPEVIKKHAAALEKYNEYQNLIKSAKTLTVPVLNQNRFLALVGYYKR